MAYQNEINMSKALNLLNGHFSLELVNVKNRFHIHRKQWELCSSYTYQVFPKGRLDKENKLYLTIGVGNDISFYFRKVSLNGNVLMQSRDKVSGYILFGLDGNLLPSIQDYNSRNMEALRVLLIKHNKFLFKADYGYDVEEF